LLPRDGNPRALFTRHSMSVVVVGETAKLAEFQKLFEVRTEQL
jgi:hypothetical protein